MDNMFDGDGKERSVSETSSSQDQNAVDFISYKATLIREYSRRKDELRKKYRHFQISDQELLRDYTALVQWYIATRRDLAQDFPDLEWEADERTDRDAEHIARDEVEALRDLRNAGHTALAGGAAADEDHMHRVYEAFLSAGGGGRRHLSDADKQALVGKSLYVQYEDGEYWRVRVVSYDNGKHTLVGYFDPSRGVPTKTEAHQSTLRDDSQDDQYFQSTYDLNTVQWKKTHRAPAEAPSPAVAAEAEMSAPEDMDISEEEHVLDV